ncbi:ABC transporter permease [Saxibacter everestensis]|uniref:ABC transporter permease n=1 Tax=Saxibacter everestensis TaxID=2909229 RepID=A0ABY8QPA1_9MICO|nr:ABC transporter permease [Brevibacteriaceae bacterium ZFBP1038]
MLIYVLRRLLQFVLTTIVATMAVFAFLRILPGDPAQVALGVNATPELLADLQRKFGTDRPVAVQYVDWASGLLTGDFGTSYVSNAAISPIIFDRVQVTLILVIVSMIIALLIAVPLGTMAAVQQKNVVGVIISGLSQVGVAVPGFLAGILLVVVFAIKLGWLPSSGWTAPAVDPVDFFRRLILPVIALGLVQSAILTRYVRSAVLEVMREDFLRTARAKGLSRSQALIRHGLRNASVPVMTVAGVQLATLLIGAVVIERVFVIPGLGSELVSAVADRDLLMVQGIVMVLVLLVLTINLVVDLMYSVLDPRIRRAS